METGMNKEGNTFAPSGRIPYLDMARGIGVVLMVVGHLLGSLEATDPKAWFVPVKHVIVSFHMPLFFILAGMMIGVTCGESRTMQENLKRKARTLLVPYAFFSVCYMVIGLVTYVQNPGEIEVSLLWKQLIFSVTFRGISVLWFLPALFIAEGIFLCARNRLGVRKGSILIAVLGICMLFMEPVVHARCWENGGYGMVALGAVILTVTRGILAASMLLFGWFLFRWMRSLDKAVSVDRMAGAAENRSPVGERMGFLRNLAGFAVGTMLVIGCSALSFCNRSVDLNYMIFGNIGLYIVCSLGSSAGVILMCRFCHPVKLLCFLGEHSLVIMATHMDFRILKMAISCGYFVSERIARAKEWMFFGTIAVVILAVEVVVILLFRYVLFPVIGRKNP